MILNYYENKDVHSIEPLHKYVEAQDLNQMFLSGTSFTFRRSTSNAIVAIVGAAQMWGDIAGIFVVLGKEYPEHRDVLDSDFMGLIKAYADTNEIHKFYSLIDSNQDKHIRWAEYFGFKYEYKMVAAGPLRQDMLGYSLII